MSLVGVWLFLIMERGSYIWPWFSMRVVSISKFIRTTTQAVGGDFGAIEISFTQKTP